MSLGLCVLVRDQQDSICVRFSCGGLFCAGPPLLCRTAGPAGCCRMRRVLFFLLLSGVPFDHAYYAATLQKRRIGLRRVQCIYIYIHDDHDVDEERGDGGAAAEEVEEGGDVDAGASVFSGDEE